MDKETAERERRINIILDPTTHKRLRIQSAQSEEPMNRIVRNLLQNHFNTESQTREEN